MGSRYSWFIDQSKRGSAVEKCTRLVLILHGFYVSNDFYAMRPFLFNIVVHNGGACSAINCRSPRLSIRINLHTSLTVVLLDNEGKEIERQITGSDASYNFKIKLYEDYQLSVLKDGFEDYSLRFQSEETETNITFKAILKLSSAKVSLSKFKP